MARQRDLITKDLFTWEPPKVELGFADDVAGRGDLENKIARLIGRALRDAKDSGKSRAQIADAMSIELGRRVSEETLNKWASEASDAHRVPLDAFIALIKATDIHDLLGFIPAIFGFAVIPQHYTELIELHLVKEQKQELEAHEARLQAKWRARR